MEFSSMYSEIKKRVDVLAGMLIGYDHLCHLWLYDPILPIFIQENLDSKSLLSSDLKKPYHA